MDRSDAALDAGAVKRVQVFSATGIKEREALGDRVTSWIRGHPEAQILRATVQLSSDRRFHCLSIVLLCGVSGPERTGPDRA